MPYRSTRLFRAQFRLLLELTLLEAAQERLMAETTAGHRYRAHRARKEVIRLRHSIDEHRAEVADWRAPTLEEDDLLRRLRPLLAVPLSPQPNIRRRLGASEQALGWLLALAAGIAWAYTVADIAARGIGNRATLIVAEVFAIALTPVAIALAGRRR